MTAAGLSGVVRANVPGNMGPRKLRRSGGWSGRPVRAGRLRHGVPAADRDDLPGDLPAGPLGRDPGERVGDVGGLGQPPQRDVLPEVLDLIGVEHLLLADGPEAGRADRVRPASLAMNTIDPARLAHGRD